MRDQRRDRHAGEAFRGAARPRGIRVNAVAPGVIDTDMSKFARSEEGQNFALDMQALQRSARSDDVADVVTFLVFPTRPRWVTGDTVQVGGGSKL